MKTLGVIAEYNPFHNGHKYHIEKSKEFCCSDYVIVVMSGNYVQRGEPALLDKFVKTKMALNNGADIVIELPTVSALSNADGFAQGGVSILNSLGVVDCISFGAESNDDELSKAAILLAEEPANYKEAFQKYLKEGNSYPVARKMACAELMDFDTDILDMPNNILALEYMIALNKLGSNIEPIVIKRSGADYHSADISGNIASATAIRNYIKEQLDFKPAELYKLRDVMTEDGYKALVSCVLLNKALFTDDFSQLLYHALYSNDNLADSFAFINEGFASRIKNNLEDYKSWSDFADALKSKNMTRAAIGRSLCKIMLGIKDEVDFIKNPEHAYARVLGFKKNSSVLLSEITKKSSIPVITSVADAMNSDSSLLSAKQKQLLNYDIKATELYNYVIGYKSNSNCLNDYRHPMVIIN